MEITRERHHDFHETEATRAPGHRSRKIPIKDLNWMISSWASGAGSPTTPRPSSMSRNSAPHWALAVLRVQFERHAIGGVGARNAGRETLTIEGHVDDVGIAGYESIAAAELCRTRTG